MLQLCTLAAARAAYQRHDDVCGRSDRGMDHGGGQVVDGEAHCGRAHPCLPRRLDATILLAACGLSHGAAKDESARVRLKRLTWLVAMRNESKSDGERVCVREYRELT